MLFSNSKKAYGGIPELAQLCIEQNIKRISYISYVFIAFQILNLFDDMFYENRFLQIGLGVMLVICVVYTVYTLVGYNSIVSNMKKARIVYLSYWCLIVLFGMTPYLITDIQLNRPVNITLLMSALIIVPMFIKSDIFLIFSLFGVYNIVLSFIYDATLNYKLLIVGISVAGVCLSFLIQQRYIDLMIKFKMETRIDPLTNTLNRRGGIDKMRTVIQLCKRHGMMVVVYMLDIDFFKDFNDTYGHIRGDQVLIELSQQIRKVFGRSSDVVCRFGGEEFVICSCVASVKDAHAMARILCESIEQLRIITPRKEVSDYLTASIGYTIYKPHDYTGPEEDMDEMSLIEEADAALYAAKNNGRNSIYSFVTQQSPEALSCNQ